MNQSAFTGLKAHEPTHLPKKITYSRLFYPGQCAHFFLRITGYPDTET